MVIIGLFGGSGTGKGLLCEIYSQRGVFCIDTDALYHRMVSVKSPCLKAIIKHFGAKYLTADGSLDRKALAEYVFDNPRELATLNKIAHKHILRECKRMARMEKKRGTELLLFDAPLLAESGLYKYCDTTILLVAPTDVRIERIVERDGISRESARKRILSQKTDEELSHYAEYIIENSLDSEHLRTRGVAVLEAIRMEFGLN